MGSTTVVLLPDWLRWLWMAVFVGTVAVHCVHAVAVRGQSRAWHAGHVVMGVGMAAMVAPGWIETGSPVMRGVFVGCTVLVLCHLLRSWTARRAVSVLWVGSLLDMVAMVYMLGAPGATPALTGAFVVYFALVALAWLVGALDVSVGDPIPAAYDRWRTGLARAALTNRRSVGQRLSLAAMAAGMAYMFLAMGIGS